MRKSIFIAVVALCTLVCACGVPSIVLDTTNKGSRIVLTNDTDLFYYDSGVMSAALGTRIHGKDTVLAVTISYNGNTKQGIFDKDDCLRFRLNDSSEFAIRNLYDKEFEHSESVQTTETPVQDLGYVYSYSPYMGDIYLHPVTVTRWIPRVYSVKKSISTGLYPITKKQLNDIITKGVAKLRIESAIGDADMPDPSGVAESFNNLYQCLHEAVRKKVSTKF